MPNPENITKLTHEQLAEYGRRGAIKSNENRRLRKAMRDELIMILSLPVQKKTKNAATKLLTVDKAKAIEDFSKKNTTVQTQILLQLSQMARKGNLKAIQLIFEITGEAKQEVNVNLNAGDEMKQYYEELTYQLKNRQIEGVDDDD